MSIETPGIQVRRSARAKYLRLVVRPGIIELVAPLAATERQVQSFLQKHRSWAEGKVREMDAKLKVFQGPGLLEPGATLPWRGREIPLAVEETSGRRANVRIDECFSVTLPSRVGPGRESVLKQVLYSWIRHWLRGEVARLSLAHAPRHGLNPRAIRIKRMVSRWGSCGPRGDININWLLALAPETVLEYVVVHELCHIRERNHSAAFWSLVAEHLPGYALERAWLKRNGPALMQRFAEFGA
ncbi:M48 family metallopeptidase [Methyloterricola oryzae]|uniref:M48 family metallopeptidase n=1 Tax=Methyloterricola oryzae TaxID=1495050 RepID=UPI0005EADF57|nr:SprT family zinc-dependent metalloprotease [Methyloterricola oryzae]